MGSSGRRIALVVALFAILLLPMSSPALATSIGLDPTFDTDGKAVTVFEQASLVTSIAVQPDGKIVAGGWSTDAGFNQSFTLVRYNADGSYDTTFDTDGIVTTAIGADYSYIYSVAIDADGKILAGGVSKVGFYTDFTLARYNTNGSLDTTFDTDGIVTTSFGSEYDDIKSIAIDADGKIVAGGYTNTSNNLMFAIARYNSDGSLDSSFDGDGKVTTPGGDYLNSIAIQSDGMIVAGGSNADYPYDFALARYDTNGSLDPLFGGTGLVTTDVGGSNDVINSVAIQPNGDIVVGGSGPGEFVVARYELGRHA